MTDPLETLLAMPLDEPADNGFSARVLTGVAEMRLRQARREAILSLVVVALVVLIGALTPAGHALGQVAEVIAATPAVWFGAFALMMSSVVYLRVRT